MFIVLYVMYIVYFVLLGENTVCMIWECLHRGKDKPCSSNSSQLGRVEHIDVQNPSKVKSLKRHYWTFFSVVSLREKAFTYNF